MKLFLACVLMVLLDDLGSRPWPIRSLHLHGVRVLARGVLALFALAYLVAP